MTQGMRKEQVHNALLLSAHSEMNDAAVRYRFYSWRAL